LEEPIFAAVGSPAIIRNPEKWQKHPFHKAAPSNALGRYPYIAAKRYHLLNAF